MGRNFKLVVTKGISAAAQIEATAVVPLSCRRYWRARFGYLQLLNQGDLQGSLTIRIPA
jgi:hypothetical protein